MKVAFWAKTTSEGMPGISVLEHMKNVGYVAQCIAILYERLTKHFNLSVEDIGALAALHDLGKISPGFQMKCDAWLKENNFSEIARRNVWDTQMESDHGKISHAAIQIFLNDLQINRRTAKFVSSILGAHHGRLNPPNDRGFRPQHAISESKTGISWDNERLLAAKTVWNFFKAGNTLTLDEASAAIWWLAGLTSVADWIGSDEYFFTTVQEDKPVKRDYTALKALETIGFKKIEVIKGLSFHDLFHDSSAPEIEWHPNEIQEKAINTITAPGVYVIEAPMGMGKTEAALWVAYNLLAKETVNGIYFALPTQATSNRIHIRMNEFVNRISPDQNMSRLIHGNSWLMDQRLLFNSTQKFSENENEYAARDWFSSAKRALLAPFGVGTVDQALLAIVASKHFFVRHFALAGKVIIIDEVHTYDLYTGTLIDKLIKTLYELGCVVIVLSATLTAKRRGAILSYTDSADGDKEPYPLITGFRNDRSLEPVSTTQPESRDIEINFKCDDIATKDAVDLASRGGSVLWICDTVDNAQKQHIRIKSLVGDSFPTGILHSRYPFWKRSDIENEWMERLGKSGKGRCGSILVSTQIVEQSVDLDADLIITELAPTDMLLQRIGRLWRHKRKRPKNLNPTMIIISEEKSLNELRRMNEKEIIESLGTKAFVYDPFVLLRTLLVWKERDQSCIKIPSQIRELLEATYEDHCDDPEVWQKLFDNRFVRNSNERFKAALASKYWQPQLLDEEGVQTRLNEVPTLDLVLCCLFEGSHIILIDKTEIKGNEEKFNLVTAQKIHKNIVKIPQYCFDKIEIYEPFKVYLRGQYTVGIVGPDHKIRVKGLKKEIQLYYSDELGLVIEKIA